LWSDVIRGVTKKVERWKKICPRRSARTHKASTKAVHDVKAMGWISRHAPNACAFKNISAKVLMFKTSGPLIGK